jgi:hypothetical protein
VPVKGGSFTAIGESSPSLKVMISLAAIGVASLPSSVAGRSLVSWTSLTIHCFDPSEHGQYLDRDHRALPPHHR